MKHTDLLAPMKPHAHAIVDKGGDQAKACYEREKLLGSSEEPFGVLVTSVNERFGHGDGLENYLFWASCPSHWNIHRLLRSTPEYIRWGINSNCTVLSALTVTALHVLLLLYSSIYVIPRIQYTESENYWHGDPGKLRNYTVTFLWN